MKIISSTWACCGRKVLTRLLSEKEAMKGLFDFESLVVLGPSPGTVLLSGLFTWYEQNTQKWQAFG